MTIKRTPQVASTLTLEEHRRLVQAVTLLVTVARRTAATKRKTRKTGQDKKENGVRKIRGPCFFANMPYHVVIVFALTQVMIMIDTVVLLLSSDMYRISDPDKFTPSARWINNPTLITSGIRSKQNTTKKELRNGTYKPYLTLSNHVSHKGLRDIILKVELSLPKLFFGDNFQELQYKDFTNLNRLLAERLASMGVIVEEDALAHAPVAAIHYAKNIVLQDGSTPYHYLQKIKEANISLRLDTNETDYRNDGHCYKWHCNSYEVVFYDKIKELEKAKQNSKRTVEKDGILQLKLLDRLSRRHKFEILRMEVRLNKRQKLKQLFAKLGIKADLTLKGLFKPAIAKKVLLHYLDELESKRPALLDYKAKSDEALLAALCINNPELGCKQVLQMLGLKKALELHTPRELRRLFARFNKRSWYRLMADVKKVKLPLTNKPFAGVREQIVKFKPCKL
jgi:hypothetical protein